MVVSEFDGTYWWIVIPDDLWNNKETMEYVEGIPIYITWTHG